MDDKWLLTDYKDWLSQLMIGRTIGKPVPVECDVNLDPKN